MRLSDAIAVGRTLLKPFPGFIFNGDDSGCALGMGFAGAGQRVRADYFYSWPWLRERLQHPCRCELSARPGVDILTHIFDHHVFGYKDWTLDQLIDWVRSVEPNEPEECPERQASSVEAGRPSIELETK